MRWVEALFLFIVCVSVCDMSCIIVEVFRWCIDVMSWNRNVWLAYEETRPQRDDGFIVRLQVILSSTWSHLTSCRKILTFLCTMITSIGIYKQVEYIPFDFLICSLTNLAAVLLFHVRGDGKSLAVQFHNAQLIIHAPDHYTNYMSNYGILKEHFDRPLKAMIFLCY